MMKPAGKAVAMVAMAAALDQATKAARRKLGPEVVKSEAFLTAAFKVFEAGVNLYAAAFFLLAPSFTAAQLCPAQCEDDKTLESPALRVCLRLFGATEILVANMFLFVLNKDNAPVFLKAVLAGDLVHFVAYFSYFLDNPSIKRPGILAHGATMSAVIVTKLLYLF